MVNRALIVFGGILLASLLGACARGPNSIVSIKLKHGYTIRGIYGQHCALDDPNGVPILPGGISTDRTVWKYATEGDLVYVVISDSAFGGRSDKFKNLDVIEFNTATGEWRRLSTTPEIFKVKWELACDPTL